MQTGVLDKLLNADDMAKILKQRERCEGAMDLVSQACANCDLKITKTTELVYQPTPEKPTVIDSL